FVDCTTHDYVSMLIARLLALGGRVTHWSMLHPCQRRLLNISHRGTRLPRLPKEVAVRRLLLAFAIVVLAFESASIVGASSGPGRDGPQAAGGSLKRVPVPVPDGLGDFVANKDAVIALGKSLFWDQQVGGDGIQACASCHFQAGADVRTTNQLNPGHNGAFNVGGPNHAFTAADFPFHQLPNPGDPPSAV